MREPGLLDFGRILRAAIEPRAEPKYRTTLYNAHDEAPPPARRKRRVGLATLAGALKEAAKAGRAVAGAEVYADHVRLEFGEPKAAEESGFVNPWDQFYAPDQKRPS